MYRLCPEHPDIARTLRTGYPYIPEPKYSAEENGILQIVYIDERKAPETECEK